jgi:hypothetical protein
LESDVVRDVVRGIEVGAAILVAKVKVKSKLGKSDGANA